MACTFQFQMKLGNLLKYTNNKWMCTFNISDPFENFIIFLGKKWLFLFVQEPFSEYNKDIDELEPSHRIWN
jgi:hypothetical protein